MDISMLQVDPRTEYISTNVNLERETIPLSIKHLSFMSFVYIIFMS